jgi:hypothetical protein
MFASEMGGAIMTYIITSTLDFTEDAIALEFAARHSGKLRYVHATSPRKWFIWDSGEEKWKPDVTRRVFWLARLVCRDARRRAHSRQRGPTARVPSRGCWHREEQAHAKGRCAMNRHERRAAAARRRRNIEKRSFLYQEYIRHLPEVPLDAPMERGRVHYISFFHDDWCRMYDTDNPDDCNCNPDIRRHDDPVRS